jgi:hypothetical protein
MKKFILTPLVIVVSFLSITVFLCQCAQAAPVISVAPKSVNLGNIPVGNTSASKTVTIANRGTSDLSIDSITITGANASEFSQISDCATMSAGLSCSITVTFTPAAPYGKKSAIINIVSNDLKKSTVKVKLSGQAPAPKISASPMSANLGSVAVGSGSSPKTVTIRNTGLSNLVINSVTIAGTNASEFSEANDCTTVPANGSCSITVTFTPEAPHGKKSAIISIISNDPKKSTVNVKLSGLAPAPRISASPMSANLGAVAVGSGSSPKTVIVRNTGLSGLVINSITITGANAGEFSQTHDCSVLTNGGTCSISFAFHPATAGKKTAEANIASNDSKKPNVVVKLSGTGLSGNGGGAGTQAVEVFAFNDLGMHCLDKDFSVFSILPPFNVLHAQVVRKGIVGSKPQILNDTQASVSYSAVADSSGSINTTSVSKTNFWDFVLPLYGISLPVDTGFLGSRMPGASNTPQSFSVYEPSLRWFAAEGIPITPLDDQQQINSYPLMLIQAFDSETASASPPLSVVVPVSDEMHCSNCHATGGAAANATTMQKYGIQNWSNASSAEIQYKENVLILHGAMVGIDFMARKPVLCSSCHYMLPLDLTGTGPQGEQIGKPRLSAAIHSRHGKTLDGEIPSPGNPAIIPDTGITTCYYCHPGTVTKCLRGAMGDAGIICQQCHGGLLAVSGKFKARTPWVDLPKCQSCHTGDAVDHLGSVIRGTMVYDPADPSATPIIAANKRFAEENGRLYRFSFGHNGIACEACHGSPHAEWPVSSTIHDNIAAIQLQGHAGPIIDCTACHADGPPLSLNGPHGLHNVNDPNWNRNHEEFFEHNSSSCKACHGLQLEGTVLSRAAADRLLTTDEHGNISITKGTQISCTLCHGNPLSGGD